MKRHVYARHEQDPKTIDMTLASSSSNALSIYQFVGDKLTLHTACMATAPRIKTSKKPGPSSTFLSAIPRSCSGAEDDWEK